MNSSSLLNIIQYGRLKSAAVQTIAYLPTFSRKSAFSRCSFYRFPIKHGLRLKFKRCKNSTSLTSQRRFFYSDYRQCIKNEPWSKDSPNIITVCNKDYATDEWTNVTPKILSYLGRNLHLQSEHPICLIKEVATLHHYCECIIFIFFVLNIFNTFFLINSQPIGRSSTNSSIYNSCS